MAKTRKAPTGAKPAQKPVQNAPAATAPQQTIVMVHYVCFSFKNGNTIKAPVDSGDSAKAVLRDVLVSVTSGKPYINEEKGILFNPVELSHSFAVVERAAQ